MLLKEKVFLSNCDSVRALEPTELYKRLLLGLTVASGVVVSPNTLLDNRDVGAFLRRANVVKYLNEEGAGQLVVRGLNFTADLTLEDYFAGLPGDYIVSSMDGAPQKQQLTRVQVQHLNARLRETQNALAALQPVYHPLELHADSLQRAIHERLQDPAIVGHFFADAEQQYQFLQQTVGLNSRSQWYQATQSLGDAFRSEVIDPAYHSLFVERGEGFLQDHIRHLTMIPASFLNTGLTIKSLQRELSVLQLPYKLFQLISSLGSTELLHFIADETMSYIEDKATEKGYDFATRKNWFGLYPKLRHYIGLEIKK